MKRLWSGAKKECVQCWVLVLDDNSKVMYNTCFIYYRVQSKDFILRTLNIIEGVDPIGHYKR